VENTIRVIVHLLGNVGYVYERKGAKDHKGFGFALCFEREK